MTLRSKILLLAILPLMMAIGAISAVVLGQAVSLAEAEIATFKEAILKSRKAELRNYISLALTSVEAIYDAAGPDDAAAQEAVKRVLNELTYGEDGYFFVYDRDGTNLVHPRQPFRVGRNWWDYQDSAGDYLIRALIARAEEGGGFHRYLWEKPSSGEVAEKISYSVMLDKWGWMLGTGLYLDDVARQVALIDGEVSARIRHTFVLIGAITLVAVGAVFVSGLWLNLAERKLADAKLQRLTRRIVEFQEEERARVSRELHDGISQILVSVKYAVELAIDKARGGAADAVTPMEKGAAGLNRAIGEVRRISRDLRPSILDDLGLSAALESLAREFSERTGIEVELKKVAFRNLLPPDAKTTLFRVAQEALTNVERHSGARRVHLHLTSTEGAIALLIADDGRGFDPGRQAKGRRGPDGLGLRNMQERMAFHDGVLRIESAPGAGTRIEARLPKGLLRRASEMVEDAA